MAQDAEIFEAVKEILSTKLKIEEHKVTSEANFFNDLGLDSLDLMTAVMGLEERFGVEIPDTELEGVDTVGQAVKLVSTKLDTGA